MRLRSEGEPTKPFYVDFAFILTVGAMLISASIAMGVLIRSCGFGRSAEITLLLGIFIPMFWFVLLIAFVVGGLAPTFLVFSRRSAFVMVVSFAVVGGAAAALFSTSTSCQISFP